MLVRCWCPGASAGAGAGVWLAVLLCPPPDESRWVRVSVTCSPDCHPPLAVRAVANPRRPRWVCGCHLHRPCSCQPGCLHAYSPACMPACPFACSLLTRTHPRPRSHAHTHTCACMHDLQVGGDSGWLTCPLCSQEIWARMYPPHTRGPQQSPSKAESRNTTVENGTSAGCNHSRSVIDPGDTYDVRKLHS